MNAYPPNQDLKDTEKEQPRRVDASDFNASEQTDTEGRQITRNRLISGIFLAAIGLTILLAYLLDSHLENAVALIILIPGLLEFARAHLTYREHGHVTKKTRRALSSGLFMTIIASVFLLNLDWSLIWVIILVVGCATVLFGGWLD